MNRNMLGLCIGIALAAGALGSNVARAATKEPLCEKTAQTMAREDRLEEGIAQIRQCLAENPQSAKAHVILGYFLLDRKAYPEAERVFDQALKLQPQSSSAKTGKGILLAREGQLKAAERILADALKLNPDPARTHYELGLVYAEQGMLLEAVNQFKQGISAAEEQGR